MTKTARDILIEYSNQFINPMLTEKEPELDLVEALKELEAIHQQEIAKARIDELTPLQSHYGDQTTVYVRDRITELSQTLKELKESK